MKNKQQKGKKRKVTEENKNKRRESNKKKIKEETKKTKNKLEIQGKRRNEEINV